MSGPGRETHSCAHCGASAKFVVDAKELDGASMQWECPECGERNATEGEDPAAIAVARADAEQVAKDVERISDGDGGSGGDKRG